MLFSSSPQSGSGPSGHKSAAGPSATRIKKPFPYVRHALSIILNVSDAMRNPDGGESADLGALDVIALSVRRNIDRFESSTDVETLTAYDNFFSPGAIDDETQKRLAQELIHGDPFKSHRDSIVQVDPSLLKINETIAAANAQRKGPASKTVKDFMHNGSTPAQPSPSALPATPNKGLPKAATLHTIQFPYLRHMFIVFEKFHGITQLPTVQTTKKTTAAQNAMNAIMLLVGKNLEALASSSARSTLETYDHLFSGKKLNADLKRRVAQEFEKGNPFHYQRALLSKTFSALEREYKILDENNANGETHQNADNAKAAAH